MVSRKAILFLGLALAMAAIGAATQVDLANEITGVLAAIHGGTGLNSVGLSGNVLTSNGSTWISAAPSGAFDARSRLHLYDEFCGGNQSSGQIGELGWLTNGGGGS